MRKKLRITGFAVAVVWLTVFVAGLSGSEAANITPQEKKLIRAAKKSNGLSGFHQFPCSIRHNPKGKERFVRLIVSRDTIHTD